MLKCTRGVSLEKEDHGQVKWSADGAWFFLPVQEGPDDYRTVAIEASLGKTALLPEPNTYLVAVSPDNEWWLYTRLTRDEVENDTGEFDTTETPLIAFNHVTGKSIKLADKALIFIHTEGASTHQYFVHSWYIWSPVIQ